VNGVCHPPSVIQVVHGVTYRDGADQ
jgi:hypothetical protein